MKEKLLTRQKTRRFFTINHRHRASHLVRVVIQNPVLGGSQGGPAGGEGGATGRLVVPDVPARPCAHLAPLLPRWSPAESRRPPAAAHAFSSLQEEDADPAEDREFPEHLQGQNYFNAVHAVDNLRALTLLLRRDGKSGWDGAGRVINIKEYPAKVRVRSRQAFLPASRLSEAIGGFLCMTGSLLRAAARSGETDEVVKSWGPTKMVLEQKLPLL